MHHAIGVGAARRLAAKAGNTTQVAQIEKEWYANADDIARFMASINPYMNEEAFRGMLHEHLRLIKDEAIATISGDYQKSIGLYNQIEPQALGMADAMSGSIIAQFPQAFRS